MALAAALTIWAGANLWTTVFRLSEITGADVQNRTVGLILSILFTLLPLVIAIYLFWTVVVGPDDPVATGKTRDANKRGKDGKTAGRKNQKQK